MEEGENMLFGCNYSSELVELIKEDESICDYIKIGAFGKTEVFMEEAYNLKPLLIHGFGWFERGGMPTTDLMDFQLMNDLLWRYESPFLGMHALAYDNDVRVVDNLLDHMVSIFVEIKDKLNIPLIIENMDFSKAYTYETTILETVRPEFITELIDKTDLCMLLDTSHALVSAYQLGIDIYDYLERLPLEMIKEIHITGSFLSKADGYIDIHGIMDETDYKIANFLAGHPRIVNSGNLEIVTLEYGGVSNTNKEAIKTQLSELKKIFKF